MDLHLVTGGNAAGSSRGGVSIRDWKSALVLCHELETTALTCTRLTSRRTLPPHYAMGAGLGPFQMVILLLSEVVALFTPIQSDELLVGVDLSDERR